MNNLAKQMTKLCVAFLTNAGKNSGVGHYAAELKRRLIGYTDVVEFYLDGIQRELRRNEQVLATLPAWPGLLNSKSVTWWRLGRTAQPLLKKSNPDVYHATNQTLSFLVTKNDPWVVTVHDVIELTDPQQNLSGMLARYLYGGIKRAAHLIAVSHYTAKQLQEVLEIPKEKITVIHNGVSGAFQPIENFKGTIGYSTLRHNLKISENTKIVLYVGSDHPRKNLVVALRAFVKFHKHFPDSVFLKVGEPGILAGRAATLAEIDRLGIGEKVRLVGSVELQYLNELYNLADVLIFPSKQEGFGLPPLQAMACGTPVVCSNATSIPEVVGEAALQRDPDDVDGFWKDLVKIIESKELANQLRAAGIERAKLFSWEATAARTLEIYRKVAREL